MSDRGYFPEFNLLDPEDEGYTFNLERYKQYNQHGNGCQFPPAKGDLFIEFRIEVRDPEGNCIQFLPPLSVPSFYGYSITEYFNCEFCTIIHDAVEKVVGDDHEDLELAVFFNFERGYVTATHTGVGFEGSIQHMLSSIVGKTYPLIDGYSVKFLSICEKTA